MSFELISDLHKDAMGCRPSVDWLNNFTSCAPDVQQEVWDSLITAMDAREALQASVEDEALRVYQARLASMMKDYKISKARAMRWDIESVLPSDGSSDLHDEDIEYYLWKQGIALDKHAAFIDIFNTGA